MWNSICTIILLGGVFSAIDDNTRKIVEDAVIQAMNNVVEQNTKETIISDETIISSQRPTEASKQLQYSGEVLEEATKILVAEYGTDILAKANKVIEEWRNESEFTSSVERRKRSVMTEIERDYRPTSENEECEGPPERCSDPVHNTIRSITGYCNNRNNRTMGNGLTVIRRLLGTASYPDGVQSMRSHSVTGSPLPSPRLISNKLHDEGSSPNYSPSINHLHMQFGQFIAHDIIFLPVSVSKDGKTLNCSQCDSSTTISSNCAPIPVPSDDKYFKQSTADAPSCLRFTRALNGQTSFGVRSQINQNTHFLDMSVVYGSSDCEAQTVRSFKNGLLLTYSGLGYDLPPQAMNDPNCQSAKPYHCFTAGDSRNSLHPGLIPLHTVFIKEHNRLAVRVKMDNPKWKYEQIYQFVRKIMIGIWQHIVYNEYLPNLLSDKYLTNFNLKPMKPGSGPFKYYDSSMDASLSAEFATAAFRIGHSQARADFQRKDSKNTVNGSYDLGNNIFYADQLYQKSLGGWETMINGLLRSNAMTVDRYFSFPIRNQLFEKRNQKGSGFDLISVNIMRGRDVGVHPYVKYRSRVGLSPVSKWSDLSTTFTTTNINSLKAVYADPADIDLYVGIVMETPLNDAQLGPTASYIISEQFKALKAGDRFYYENVVPGTINFTEEQLDAIRRVKFAKIICENTEIINSINVDVFKLNGPQTPCSSIPDLDLKYFYE